MSDIVELKQWPVGHYLNKTAGGPFVYCRHGGWWECELHAYYLCAKTQKSTDATMTDPGYKMFNFIECVNDQNGYNTDPGHFPTPKTDAVRTCATKLGYSWDALYQCAHTDGIQQQVTTAAEGESRGVTSAPTLYIDGKRIDGMSISLKQICDAYDGKKPAACSSAAVEQPETRSGRAACQV